MSGGGPMDVAMESGLELRRREVVAGMLGAGCAALLGSSAGVAADEPGALAESWVEPPLWRPSDAPGQPLELTVVARPNPRPPYDAGPSVQFLYNNAMPGP